MAIPKTKRSGGPRTSAGKAAAAGNALKSGAYSNITVLPGESAEEYRAIEDQLRRDFQPTDLIEASIVRDLASLIWKKLRLEKLEHAAYLQLLSQDLTADEVIREYRGPQPNGNYRKFLFRESADGREYLDDLTSEVRQVRKALATDRASITREVLTTGYPYLAKRLNDCIIESNRIEFGERKIETHGKPLHHWDMKISLLRSSNFLDWMIEDTVADISGLAWVLSNQQAIEKACHAAKETRLHKLLFADKSPRAFDDLNRALYKTLSELRKHQEWRSHRPIDITPDLDSDHGD